MQILITGATGYLGSRLCESLTGHEIIRFDSKSSLSEVDNPDLVIHCATNYGRNNESESHIHNVNFAYGKELLERCKDSRFINIGTSLPDINAYSKSKKLFSHYGKSTHENFLDIKLEHFYGPNNNQNNFITFVSDSCKRNEPELKLSSGKQQRDFIFIDDVIEAIKMLMEIEIRGTVAVGSGKLISIRQVVEKIHRLHNSTTKLLFGAIPDRGEEMSAADITDIVFLTGWQPRHEIDEGLLKTCV